jgi:hypothetical protein
MEEHITRLLYDLRGAAMEVYNTLGPGLLESVYELLNKPAGLLVNFGENDFGKGLVTLENKLYIPHD